MKTTFKYLLIVALALSQTLVMGRENRRKTASKSIDGPWQVVEIAGKTVETGENIVFLNFDVLKKQVNGFTGCNYMHGKFKLKAMKSVLIFQPAALTRMMCPESETENKLTQQIGKVASYRTELTANNTVHLILLDKEGTELIRLNQMMPLDGKWKIGKVNDSDVNPELEAFLVFNSAQNRVYGKFGCNNYSASFTPHKKKPALISIGQGITTMMACPDMQVEQEMLKTLPTVVSFKKFSDRKAILCDASGKTVIELTR